MSSNHASIAEARPDASDLILPVNPSTFYKVKHHTRYSVFTNIQKNSKILCLLRQPFSFADIIYNLNFITFHYTLFMDLTCGRQQWQNADAQTKQGALFSSKSYVRNYREFG